jgi:hypothetical protein
MTRADILKLQASGKIRGHNLGRIESDPDKKVKLPEIKEVNKCKNFIELNLQYWCNQKSVTLERETKFDDNRKWRFDWSIPAFKIAIEYEGLAFHRTHHTSSDGYTKNADKYNQAAVLGWTVLRFTFKNYTDLVQKLNYAYDQFINSKK